MVKRIGNVTVANIWLNVGAYYNHTPYRTTFVGCNLFSTWRWGRCVTPGVDSFAFGPFVVGRYNLANVGKAVR